MRDILTGIAFFLVIEGLVYALAPSIVVDMLRRLPDIAPERLRLFGVAAVAAGVGLVWIVRG